MHSFARAFAGHLCGKTPFHMSTHTWLYQYQPSTFNYLPSFRTIPGNPDRVIKLVNEPGHDKKVLIAWANTEGSGQPVLLLYHESLHFLYKKYNLELEEAEDKQPYFLPCSLVENMCMSRALGGLNSASRTTIFLFKLVFLDSTGFKLFTKFTLEDTFSQTSIYDSHFEMSSEILGLKDCFSHYAEGPFLKIGL